MACVLTRTARVPLSFRGSVRCRYESAMRSAAVLSVFWFLSLGALGVFFPFYSLFLSENAGLSGVQVGMVMAVVPLVGMVAQPLWGNTADRSGSRARILALLCFGAAAGYVNLYFGQGFVSILLGTAGLAVFSTALIPMSVSVTLGIVEGRGPHAFGLVRVWGTLGFLITVVAFPKALEAWQDSGAFWVETSLRGKAGLELMLPVAALLLVLAGAVSLMLRPDGSLGEKSLKGDWRLLMQHGPFLRLLVFMFAAYVFMQGPMAMFPVFVRSLGGGLDAVSKMWVLMLLLEIPLMALSGAGLARLGARGLIAVGLGAGALRWLVCGFSDNMTLVYAVQVLHGVTVIGLIIGAPLYVEAVAPPRLRATGQGLLAMVGVSLGGILSNLNAGWMISAFGADAPAKFGGVGALLLVLVLPWVLPRAESAELREAHKPREELNLAPQ